MNRSRFPFRRSAASGWCLALMLGTAFAGAVNLALAQTGPLPSSPGAPYPYQSSGFHPGGALTPGAAPYTATPAQLQGTPTGDVTLGGVLTPTQIPSFLLGYYNPLLPPGGLAHSPEHFADGTFYSWLAPFNYIPSSASTVSVDDSNPAPTAGPPATSGFAITGGYVNVSGAAGAGDVPAGTATGGEYDRLPPDSGTPPSATNSVIGTATWTLVATAAGSFSVYFHIPDDVADTLGNVEPRSSSVTYSIAVSGAFAQTMEATASQTEANSLQYLAGPFQLAAGDTLTVTLQRNTNQTNSDDAKYNKGAGADYLIADSMTLQTAIGDVRSTPTAINYDSYPNDFKRAQYWGIYVPTGATAVAAGATQPIGTTVAANALPDYGPNSNPPIGPPSPVTAPVYLRLGDPNGKQPDGTTVDGEHRIRQLVYFGRTEPLINYTVRVDDLDGAPRFTTNAPFQTVKYIPGPPVSNANASTATNGEYLTSTTAGGTASAQATWTFTAPAQANYFLSVHLPEVGAAESRITDATYHVAVNGTALPDVTGFSQIPPGSGAADVTLPTVPLALAKGDVVKVTLDNTTAVPTANNVVVADSITLTTGNGQGAIYCVDGFTGGVVWRYQTPASPRNGPSAPVFSSPTVARINVLVNPGDPNANPAVPPTYDNRLVVIVGDNNGQVYCLDAIGNGDGTSNADVLNADGQPVTAAQPAYGTTAAVFDPAKPHVGTTSEYWIYRPDPSLPKDLGTGNPRLDPADATGKTILPLPDRDLPVPGSFGAASPTIYVDPSVAALAGPIQPATPVSAAALAAYHNATVYLGNSNGVLYALDATGVPYSTTNQATSLPYNKTAPASTPAPYGDTFNPVLDLRGGGVGAVVPTCQPQWWFSIRGENPNSATTATSADIESAPALYVATTPAVAPATGTTYTPTVYVGSAHEQESTSNIGFLYAVNGTYGPSGNGGKSDPRTTAGLPGTLNYNLDPRPTLPTVGGVVDTADWTFPDKYGTQPGTINASAKARPGLGNLTGSPVVFTNFHETTATHQTRIYFTANSGLEVPAGTTATVAPTVRPDDTTTGRVWAVNLDGSVGTTTNKSGAGAHVWAYPLANDPNDSTKDKTAEPFAPIGSFLHMTPAIGYVQFPATIKNGDGSTYTHQDAIQTALQGQTIPMLYVATRGGDIPRLYHVDIDGDADPAKTIGTPGYDDRTIFFTKSPDLAIFQSSPILITNATTTGGNGGSLLIVGGNTLYDFSATPVSNLVNTDAVPAINENASYTGFGPLSGPAVAAATVYDTTLTTGNLTFTTAPTVNIVTDWVYVGDTSTGLCKGITPRDPADGNIPPDLGDIVPPDVSPPEIQDLSSILRSYLVIDANKNSPKYADRLVPGDTAPLPVYDWGENAYIRFANVVPPNGGTLPGVFTNPNNPNPPDPTKFMHDQDPLKTPNLSPTGALTATSATPQTPVRVYWNPGTATNNLTFFLSDGIDGSSVDSATIPSVKPDGTANLYTTATTPLTVGFIARPTSDNDTTDNNLIDNNGHQYIAAYTYAIGDGTARKNTPGARRRVQDATLPVISLLFIGGDPTQISSYAADTAASATVLRASTTSGNLVSVPVRNASGVITGYTDKAVKPADQPTFGILNPIGLRAGGIPLPLFGGASSPAQEIGDPLGPFRGVDSPMQLSPPKPEDKQALTNGNTVFTGNIPPSTTGGGNPTILPLANDPSGSGLPTAEQVVVTSTGLIPHNSSGENADSTTSPLPTGVYPSGLSGSNFGSPDSPYAADVFDRSALGTVAKALKLKTGVTPETGREGLYWNDNSTNVTGHDSVVNYLPWETPPTAYKVGANTSPDYPDIGPQNVAMTLHANDNTGGSTASLSSDGAVATPATTTSTVLQRTVSASPLQVQISVPHYQPANQQLYQKASGTTGYNSAGEISPLLAGTNNVTTNEVFPMGYVTIKRIYVPNQSGRYEPGCAYRDIRIYTGVPVSMSTSVADGTIDIGKVPSAFGIQTNQFSPLGPFTPYTPAFQPYFLPITVHNDGNVNLLNVHMDQKVDYGKGLTTLPMQSDPVDPLTEIPAYDFGGMTGPRGTFGTGAGAAPEFPFLIRSSLDTDLVAASGFHSRNPSADTTVYPGATLHKALPGSGTPSTLTVPDAPETTVAGASLNTAPNGLPTLVPDTSNGNLPFKALPHVSVAIPFGTPVGSYRQMVRVFEGLDTLGYSTYITTGPDAGRPNPYYPPQYGQAVGGQGKPAVTAQGFIMDPGGYVPNNKIADVLKVGVHPMSDPGVTVRATVLENRMTDGATFGALPQVDAGPAIPGNPGATPPVAGQSTPDFAPAAFRDPSSGNLSLLWTSGRSGSGFGIYQTTVPTLAGAFMPINPKTPGTATSPNYVNEWWTSLADATAGYNLNGTLKPALSTPGTYSGLTVAQDYSDLANVFAFATDVAGTAPYQNVLYSYTLTPSTGGLSNPLRVTPVTDDATVKYGVHGLYTKSGFGSGAPSLWAFWTSVTRGRTAISYNSFGSNNAWLPTSGPSTVGLLPVPAGLSSVADPSPVLMTAPVIATGGVFGSGTQSVVEVTYSGVAPSGNTDLYQSRYVPIKDATTGVYNLALASYPTVTENLSSVDAGWYQARDVAWSRTGALNLTLNGNLVLYDPTGKALFSRAVFDKASGLLVMSGVSLTGAATGGTTTVYADLATGRIKFSPALPTTITGIAATFNPLARRITTDNRADTAPVTFLDSFGKVNDAAGVPNALPANVPNVEADRRWYVWRKSGVTGVANSATLYYKTQRLSVFLPKPVDVTVAGTLTIKYGPGLASTYSGPVDIHNIPVQFNSNGTVADPASAVLYFPILDGSTSLEGQPVSVSYKATDTTTAASAAGDTIQWQDEERSNDNAAAPTNAAAGLARVNTDYAVPLDTPVNENNVSAFLDPFASPTTEHKVWLFWNSTRNGTADLYMETINPRF